MTTYLQAHNNVYKERGEPSKYPCIGCGGAASQWAYNHRAKNELRGTGRYPFAYSEDTNDYQPMCMSCHRKLDYQENPEALEERRQQLTEARSTPKFRAATSAVMTALNGQRRKCRTCGLVSLPGGLGKHLKDLGHEGWDPC